MFLSFWWMIKAMSKRSIAIFNQFLDLHVDNCHNWVNNVIIFD